MVSSLLVMVDPLAGTPVYVQLADLLRAGIADGTYPPRRPLPSAKSLSQEYGIAIGTVMKAFDLLKAEGLITTVPGRGMWVVPPKDD